MTRQNSNGGPPYDPELAVALEAIEPIVSKFESLDSIAAARASNGAMPAGDLTLDGTYVLEDRLVPGPAGAPDITLLICRPADATGPAPCFYHTHGGGMVVGDRRTSMEMLLKRQAAAFRATMVSVEYRLAPENPHPAPVEDCYAGLVWTAAHAAELGIDPRQLIIMGVSAGGGLAAATALLARDRNGPALLGQMLMCPMLDDRNDTVSARQLEGRGIWDRRANNTGWTALLGAARGTASVSPYAAPARATDLSGLPPALIDVGSTETFRDEAVAYAQAIWSAGGDCDLHVWAGGFHGYCSLAPEAAVSTATHEVRTGWLRRILARANQDTVA
jgi:acetyl esterase/lipase